MFFQYINILSGPILRVSCFLFIFQYIERHGFRVSCISPESAMYFLHFYSFYEFLLGLIARVFFQYIERPDFSGVLHFA